MMRKALLGASSLCLLALAGARRRILLQMGREMGSETCSALEMDGDTLMWLTAEGARYPSKVLPRDQLPK